LMLVESAIFALVAAFAAIVVTQSVRIFLSRLVLSFAWCCVAACCYYFVADFSNSKIAPLVLTVCNVCKTRALALAATEVATAAATASTLAEAAAAAEEAQRDSAIAAFLALASSPVFGPKTAAAAAGDAAERAASARDAASLASPQRQLPASSAPAHPPGDYPGRLGPARAPVLAPAPPAAPQLVPFSGQGHVLGGIASSPASTRRRHADS
jgi:hypothetical protein